MPDFVVRDRSLPTTKILEFCQDLGASGDSQTKRQRHQKPVKTSFFTHDRKSLLLAGSYRRDENFCRKGRVNFVAHDRSSPTTKINAHLLGSVRNPRSNPVDSFCREPFFAHTKPFFTHDKPFFTHDKPFFAHDKPFFAHKAHSNHFDSKGEFGP